MEECVPNQSTRILIGSQKYLASNKVKFKMTDNNKNFQACKGVEKSYEK